MKPHTSADGSHQPNKSSTAEDAHSSFDTGSEYYPWLQSTPWLQHVQPIPPDQLPGVTGPMVYEGFVPESGANQAEFLSSWPTERYDAPEEDGSISASARRLGTDARLGLENEVGMSMGYTENYATSEMLEASSRDHNLSEAPSDSQARAPVISTQKRGRRKGGTRRGLREVADPGEEFQAYHAQATAAFLDEQDLDKATELILKAISLNPEIYSAHALLSEIHFARGDNEKAIATLFSGAHASPNDPIIWHQLADTCLQKSTGDHNDALRQASYCYSRIVGIDRDDGDARFQKATISKELGYHAKALKDAQILLEQWPHNSDVLRLIAEVCLQFGDVTKAKSLYEEALETQKSDMPTVEEAFTWTDLMVYTDLILHADGVQEAIKSLKEIARWMTGRGDEPFWSDVDDDREFDAEHSPRRIQTPAFQMDCHGLEMYGQALPLEIRVKLGDLRLTQGRRAEAFEHYEWLDPEAVGQASTVYEYPDLFLQIADSLRDMREYKQAFRYYKALYDIQAYDDLDFWLGVGSCAYHCGLKEDALHFYEQANQVDAYNAETHTQLAKLYGEKRIRSKAIYHSKAALELYKVAIPKTSKRRYERKETREARIEAQQAYRQAYMLTPPPEESKAGPLPSFSRRAREKARRQERDKQQVSEENDIVEPSGQDLDFVPFARPSRPPTKRRLTKARRTQEQQEENIRHVYAALCDQSTNMRLGDEEARSLWIEHAEALVEDFRSQKLFYPTERSKVFQGHDHKHMTYGTASADQEDFAIPSIEPEGPSEYCGIMFSAWLELFLEYAVLLANLQYEATEVYAIINAAQSCAVWYNDQMAMTQIYSCYLICALALEDEATLFSTVLRWFIREYDSLSDAYHLFSAINFYYPHTPDKAGKAGQVSKGQFRQSPLQKFLFRQLVFQDSQLPAEYGIETPYGSVPIFMRKERGDMRSTKSSDVHHVDAGRHMQGVRVIQAEEMNIALLNLYGQILYAGGSFSSALSYFYRALSLDPDNPVLLLTISLCYFNELFKRTNDNRHMYFLQGWALFEEYASHRISQAQRSQSEDAGLLEAVKAEVHFNRARCWQMNGLADLALREHEKILERGMIKGEDQGEVDRGDSDYIMETAYAVALAYASNGDAETARAVTEKWLVVE